MVRMIAYGCFERRAALLDVQQFVRHLLRGVRYATYE